MAPRSRVESEDEERPLADASCATLGRRSRSSSRRGRPARVDVALGRARLAAGGFANDDAGVRARAVVCALRGGARSNDDGALRAVGGTRQSTFSFYLDWDTCSYGKGRNPKTGAPVFRNECIVPPLAETRHDTSASSAQMSDRPPNNLKWEDFSRTRNARNGTRDLTVVARTLARARSPRASRSPSHPSRLSRLLVRPSASTSLSARVTGPPPSPEIFETRGSKCGRRPSRAGVRRSAPSPLRRPPRAASRGVLNPR